MRRSLLPIVALIAIFAHPNQVRTQTRQATPPPPTAQTLQTTSDPNCTLRVSLCETRTVNFAFPRVPSGYVTEGLNLDTLNAWGPGLDGGNASAWRTTLTHSTNINVSHRGITNGFNVVMTTHGNGDNQLFDGYLYTDGGAMAQSDEGVNGMTLHLIENYGYFHGTIVSGGLKPTLRWTAGSKSTTDGAFLLDISKGIAGSFTGPTQPLPGSYLNFLRVTPIPVTSAWGWALSSGAKVIRNPELGPTGLTPITLTLTLGAIGGVQRPFVPGGTVCVAGVDYPEQATLLAAGPVTGLSQSVTLGIRNPNQSITVFQGGVCGRFLSMDADYKHDAAGVDLYRSSFYAFGSLTGTDLIYGSALAGGIPGQLLPTTGSSAETTSPGLPTSGFHLFPGAEIVVNNSLLANPTLEPNSVDWQPGDLVENPHHTAFAGRALNVIMVHQTPANPSFPVSGIDVEMNGAGVAGGDTPLFLNNLNAASVYGGGVVPPRGILLGGLFGDLISSGKGPSESPFGYTSVINIDSTADGTARPFHLFSLPRMVRGQLARGGAKFLYDPATGSIHFPFGATGPTLPPGDDSQTFATDEFVSRTIDRAIAGQSVQATPGPEVSSVACVSASCTSRRGTYAITGGTAGTILSLAWSAEAKPPVCSATQNGGATWLGVGNTPATPTGLEITAAVPLSGRSFTINYACTP